MTRTGAVSRSSILLLALLSITLSGCGITDADVRRFEETRRYEHFLFDSQEACDAAQPDGFHINCSQWVTFGPDGSATMVVTDIVNPATYVVVGDRVLLSLDGTPELPARVEFRLSEDQNTLTWTENGTVWVRVEPAS